MMKVEQRSEPYPGPKGADRSAQSKTTTSSTPESNDTAKMCKQFKKTLCHKDVYSAICKVAHYVTGLIGQPSEQDFDAKSAPIGILAVAGTHFEL